MRCCIKFDFCMNLVEFDELVFSLTDDELEVLDMRRRFWRTRARRMTRPGGITTILRQCRNKKSARS